MVIVSAVVAFLIENGILLSHYCNGMNQLRRTSFYDMVVFHITTCRLCSVKQHDILLN